MELYGKEEMTLREVKNNIKRLSDPAKAAVLRRFFKTGPGEYGHGDLFAGITVPAIRNIAAGCGGLAPADIVKLLKSPVHEERLLALVILIGRYKKSGHKQQRRIYRLYISNTKYINNWDLVDISCHHIVGHYLSDKDKGLLLSFARSPDMWKRRIAVVSTFHYIRNNDHRYTLQIAKLLLGDEEDLLHKATGWMLREVGKRDLAALEAFLKKYHYKMPRTMLRYAIERLPEHKRKSYLKR